VRNDRKWKFSFIKENIFRYVNATIRGQTFVAVVVVGIINEGALCASEVKLMFFIRMKKWITHTAKHPQEIEVRVSVKQGNKRISICVRR